MQVKYTPGLNCMIWSWSFTKLSENPLCELTSVDMWIHDPFWPQNINIHINIYGYGTVILSLSVSNMYISRIPEHFQLKWKMNVGGRFVYRAILVIRLQSLLDGASFSLWITSSLNHSGDSFLLFCTYPWLRPLWVFFPVNESRRWKAVTCGKYLVLHISQHTVCESEDSVCWCLVKWIGTDCEGTIVWCALDWCMVFWGFFACGLACKVGWLVENDHRVASTKCHIIVLALWLQLADVNIVHVVHFVSCKMGCIHFYFYFNVLRE